MITCNKTPQGLQKPDLVVKAIEEDKSYIIDISVVVDNTEDVDILRQRKIDYYNRQGDAV